MEKTRDKSGRLQSDFHGNGDTVVQFEAAEEEEFPQRVGHVLEKQVMLRICVDRCTFTELAPRISNGNSWRPVNSSSSEAAFQP